jgi:hypothetical protein
MTQKEMKMNQAFKIFGCWGLVQLIHLAETTRDRIHKRLGDVTIDHLKFDLKEFVKVEFG